MSWFEEQIKERKQQDNDLFSDSILKIADAISGKKDFQNVTEISESEIHAILHYFGYNTKTEVPKDMVDVHEQLAFLCRPYGLMFREVNLSDKWWKDCTGPILAFHRENERVIALIPDWLGYYFYQDGKKVRVNQKNSQVIGSSGYCFYQSFPNRKLNLLDLVKFALCTRSVQDIVLTLSFMGISTLIGLLVPKITYFLYSTVVEEKSSQLLITTMVFFISVGISSLLFETFRKMYDGIISTKMEISLQSATMMRVLSMPVSFFKKYSSGELADRSGYLTLLTQMLMNTLFGTGLSSLFSLAYISSVFQYAPKLVIPAFLLILINVTFSIFVIFSRQKITKDVMEMHSKESGMTYAMISGIKKIKIAGAERRAFARWADLYAKEIGKVYNPPSFIKISDVISLAISAFSTLVMYYFAIDSGVQIAEYTAFSAAYGILFGAFSNLTSIATTYTSIKPVYDLAKPLMDQEPEVSENKEVLQKLNGQIELSNVTFSYEKDMPHVVKNLSLKILPNQYIGIVGKTGCGKSTLIRLLLGFEKPQKGSVFYDGKDLNSLDLKSLRRKIGVVMQDDKLFQGDIFSNITISAPWLTEEEAWEAAEIAGVAEDIARMPMGMHTLLSEGSGGISGGQKQRLMIARAIAPKPKVLIFDEATSALDNITQKKVSEALDKLHCTRIIIAHRLSTIKCCDRIFYLEDGAIQEEGTYEELLEKKGLFYELVERQRLED